LGYGSENSKVMSIGMITQECNVGIGTGTGTGTGTKLLMEILRVVFDDIQVRAWN